MPRTLLLFGLALAAGGPAAAQPPRKGPPPYTSPEVKGGQVTFRLPAAKAERVGLASSDLPGGGPGLRAMTKGEGDLWEVTLEGAPGTYRYRLDVDGVPVVDPRNPAVSASFGNAWSLVRVPGAAFMDTAAVPHGAVAAVTYHSTTTGRTRRAHVCTPPGYEANADRYPVFYLLHGAGDSDHSWTSVGRAHDILDNPIAAKTAVPMVVVVPAGHDGKFAPGRPTGAAPAARFEDDFETDLRPHVGKTYRVKTGRADRAIAGLSMGGLQTLNVFAARPADYAAVGVFSSGVFGSAEAQAAWAKRHAEGLSAAATDGPKVLWFATGRDDFVLNSTKGTVGRLKKLALKPEYKETEGGHTWVNWQLYLNEFAPKLFR